MGKTLILVCEAFPSPNMKLLIYTQNLHLSHVSTEQSTNSSLVCLYDLQRNVKEQQKKPKTLLPFLALRVQYLKYIHSYLLKKKQPLIKSDFLWVKCKWRFICRKVGWRKLVYFVSIMTVFCKKCLFAPLCYQKAHNHSRNTHAITVGKNTMNTRTRWNSNTMKWRGVTQANRKQRKSKLQINTQEFVVSVPPKTAGTF